MVQAITIAKVAFGTLITATGVQAYFKWKIQGEFQKAGHHIKSISIMKGYQPIKDYLGEPIRPSWFDVNDDFNKCDGLNAHFSIPVYGPKGQGQLYYWSSREKAGNEWEVDKLDFQKHETQQRWTFYIRNKENKESKEEDKTSETKT